LDCLLNFSNPNENFSNNGNYVYYFNEIKRFAPDLIISDFDIYTSVIALEMGVKLWQASPLLLYYAAPYEIKYRARINKNYSHLLNSNFRKKEFINHVINNSDRKFVISHLCDSEKRIVLAPGFEWVRPEFVLADKVPEEIEYLVVRPGGNRKIIDSLQGTNSVMFSEFYHEKYEKFACKNIHNWKDYGDQLGKCKVFISDGGGTITSDAFYNQKKCLFDLRHDDVESIMVSLMNEHLGLGRVILETPNADNLEAAKIVLDDKVKFLSEELQAL
jgi:hypothetical protein